MRNTELEVSKAVENLKVKIPGLNWKVSGAPGERQTIECYVDQPVGLGEAVRKSATDAFKTFLKSNGVELDFYVSATSRGNGWVTVQIRDPLIIRSLSNNIFIYPPSLEGAKNTYIAAILSKKTGFQWKANGDGTVSCDAWMPYPRYGAEFMGETNFKYLVKQSGIEFTLIT